MASDFQSWARDNVTAWQRNRALGKREKYGQMLRPRCLNRVATTKTIQFVSAFFTVNKKHLFLVKISRRVTTKYFLGNSRSWARDNTALTTWPCFQATKLLVTAFFFVENKWISGKYLNLFIRVRIINKERHYYKVKISMTGFKI